VIENDFDLERLIGIDPESFSIGRAQALVFLRAQVRQRAKISLQSVRFHFPFLVAHAIFSCVLFQVSREQPMFLVE
jgi:hypothetical protein